VLELARIAAVDDVDAGVGRPRRDPRPGRDAGAPAGAVADEVVDAAGKLLDALDGGAGARAGEAHLELGPARDHRAGRADADAVAGAAREEAHRRRRLTEVGLEVERDGRPARLRRAAAAAARAAGGGDRDEDAVYGAPFSSPVSRRGRRSDPEK
jgi:hypothetical protein